MNQKLTKGYMKNTKTGVIMQFIYNPTTFSTKRGAKYTEITSPGASYPFLQYSGGESKSLKYKLMLANNINKIKEWEQFLNALLPPDKFTTNYAPPASFIFAYGSNVMECYLNSLGLDYQYFKADLTPRVIEADLDIRVVG